MNIPTQMFDDCTVLIVDDQSTSISILSHVVKSVNPNIKIIEKTCPLQAMEWATEHIADLVYVDYVMPNMDGVDFVRLLKTIPSYAFVQVIMISVNKDPKTRYAALDAGVADFLNKPVDIYECTARTKNLLTLRQQHAALQNKSLLLESLVQISTADIKMREKETIMRLARAGEYKDFDTAMHLQRMSLYSKALAEAIGLSPQETEIIQLASPLHDLGKIGIPDSILLKSGPLNSDEMQNMRRHPLIGYEILKGSPSKYLQKGGEIALAHHEKYDGSGYPHGIKGDAIPLSARIVALADVFDALTSERPYKKAWSIDQAYEYIENQSGKHFDPALVKAFIGIRSSVERIHMEHAHH